MPETSAHDANGLMTDQDARKYFKIMIIATTALIISIICFYPFIGMMSDNHCIDFAKIAVVALCGALGAMIYILNSYTNYWGNRTLAYSWRAFYFAKPFLGSALALCFYFLAGTKLWSDPNASDSQNYLLAVSILVGMFTDKASTKLADIVKVLLSSADDRTDKLNQQISMILKTPEPEKVLYNIPTPIKVEGERFSDGLSLLPDTKGLVTNAKIQINGAKGDITFDYQLTQKDIKAGDKAYVYVIDTNGTVKAVITLKAENDGAG